ncbi:response regulator receiver domain-containing protein [Brevirhabdus pacifica]|nr:response regulator receiver domain-containing protein [Brevirhabdus pacifica]
MTAKVIEWTGPAKGTYGAAGDGHTPERSGECPGDKAVGADGERLVRPAPHPPGALPHSVTILLVEDSRCASDAIRRLCQASGIRVRRADCLKSARRHLATYRPALVIVDIGLPDGSGLDLVAELRQQPTCPAIIATSGDDTRMKEALIGGADGFVAKPFGSLAAFQRILRNSLPPESAAACRFTALERGDPIVESISARHGTYPATGRAPGTAPAALPDAASRTSGRIPGTAQTTRQATADRGVSVVKVAPVTGPAPTDRPVPSASAHCGQAPDQLTFRDDLRQARRLIHRPGEAHLPYVAQFVGGLALISADAELGRAARDLARAGRSSLPALEQAIHERLEKPPLI